MTMVLVKVGSSSGRWQAGRPDCLDSLPALSSGAYNPAESAP